MFSEFKEFAMRGNVVDMAVGIIVGGDFGTIAKSLVNDVLMPPIGLLVGGMDFSNFFYCTEKGGLTRPLCGARRCTGRRRRDIELRPFLSTA